MAGKDDIADAVLGGASDFMSDIFAKLVQWFYEPNDDQKVLSVHVLMFVYVCNVMYLTVSRTLLMLYVSCSTSILATEFAYY